MNRGYWRVLLGLALICGGTAAHAAEKISLYFPIAVGGEIAKFINRMVDEFEATHPQIDIDPVYAGTYKEALDKALTAHKNGAPPTLAVLHAVDIYTLLDADAILPFDEKNKQDAEWLKDFYPAFMANSRVAGKTWGIPFQRSVILLYWNKQAFRTAGLPPDKPPRNWDEMRSMARQLTQRDANGKVTRWGLQIPSSGFPYWMFQGLVTTNGGTLMNRNGTETWFDAPAAVEALDYWVSLSKVERAHPPGDVEWADTPEDFLDGHAAMIWTTSGNLAHIKSKVELEFGVAELPANKRYGVPTGGGNFYLFKKSTPAQRAAALEFVKWMTDPLRAAQWSINTGYIAVRKSAWDTPLLKEYARRVPQANVARASLENAVPELSTHENQRVTKALNDGLSSALKGEKSPQQALREAQAKAANILHPYQR
ncbi:MAG TPA: ABC transporter substrate-binding protein [Gallionella sp.]|nr:ABC transporter substrate-binding protein [Gallionella sp.]